MGLVVAKTEVIRVQPVRSEERARAVAELLQRSGALPQIEKPKSDTQDAKVVEDPETEPEDTPRRPVRRK